MYQALYRKWRPRVFADVVGQEHVTRTLQKQVAEGRTSHAYLFTGTRGTGKTTCAKILARAVNCEHPVDGNPCGTCAACVGLENESFLDVLELDAASNNGVDQVRALRDEAIYSPANVKKRVYIIDEVHMLSVPAFNALLKILEEPPEHLMFILATTELHKVPATILSRCQRYAFRRIRPEDIRARLQYVAAQEGMDLTEDGAELLSRLADGALRDGLSLLDQCAAAGGRIDSAAVLDALGLAGRQQTAALLEQVLNRETAAALETLGQAYDSGKDVGAVLGELADLVRDLLILRTAPHGGTALLSGGYDAPTLDRLGKLAGTSRLLYLASTLQKASAELYNSANRRTDAELCILRLCDEALSGGAEALAARVERLEGELDRLRRGGVTASRPAPPDRVPAPDRGPVSDPLPVPDPVAKPDRTAESDRAAVDRTPAPAQDTPPWEDDAPTMNRDAPPWLDDAPTMDRDAPPWLDETPPDVDAPTVEPETPPVRDAVPPEPRPDAAPVESDAVREPERVRSGIPSVPKPANPDGRAIPAETAPSGGGGTRTDAHWWREVMERSCNRLPPMNRSFLKRCEGVREGDLLIVHAPDSTTLGRLNNDRVKGVLLEESGAARVTLGEGPLPPPREGTPSAGSGPVRETAPSPEPSTSGNGTPSNDVTPSGNGTPSNGVTPSGNETPSESVAPSGTAAEQEANLRRLVAFSREHGFPITGSLD